MSSRKKASLSPVRKAAKKQRKEEQESFVDTNFYEVESVVGSKVDGRTVSYLVKWKGYEPEDNTYEPQWRLACTEKLTNYLSSVVNEKTYGRDVALVFGNLDRQWDNETFAKLVNPLSVIAELSVFCGAVKFVEIDSVGSKKMFLNYLQGFNQEYLCNSLLVPKGENLEDSMCQYMKQLRYQSEIFEEYPVIRINLPVKLGNTFFAPPPLSNLLFEPATEAMMMNRREHLFPPKSSMTGFNNSRVFIHSSYFDSGNDIRLKHPRYVPPNLNTFQFMDRLNYKNDPRFLHNLDLRQETGSGWILTAPYDLEPETPLLMMTGVICSSRVARQSLLTEGERVAFSSFIEIPFTGLCLDRRQFHDFSKYIPHSCTPTCAVRLVESGNEIPDFVVYTKVALNEKNGHAITLDWFRLFTSDVRRYFSDKKYPDGKVFYLYEEDIDFVQCQCDSRFCRQVLYIDQAKNAKDKSATKKEKLAQLDIEFNGMDVAEDDSVWRIDRGRFN